MRLIMEQDAILAVQKEEEEEVGTTRNVSVPSLHSLSLTVAPFLNFPSLSVSLSLSLYVVVVTRPSCPRSARCG